jgi:hypothetical protein
VLETRKGVWASPLASRLAVRTGRNGFVSYGLLIHLLLLPTPPYGDAVTFGYRPECVYLEWTFTSLAKYAYRRTSRHAPHAAAARKACRAGQACRLGAGGVARGGRHSESACYLYAKRSFGRGVPEQSLGTSVRVVRDFDLDKTSETAT